MKRAVIELVLLKIKDEYVPVEDGHGNFLFAETVDGQEPDNFFWVNNQTGDTFKIEYQAMPMYKGFIWSGVFEPETEQDHTDEIAKITQNFHFISPMMDIFWT